MTANALTPGSLLGLPIGSPADVTGGYDDDQQPEPAAGCQIAPEQEADGANDQYHRDPHEYFGAKPVFGRRLFGLTRHLNPPLSGSCLRAIRSPNNRVAAVPLAMLFA